ncbi:hypothetical protein DRQ53_06895 [bacterium]|nr:MAG: hypothetical protein DRQ53_06895 [bacterium]
MMHGMEHAGLSPAALVIERSRDFKRSFRRTITESLGWSDGRVEIPQDGSVPGFVKFLSAFGPDGHPPEGEAQAFVQAELNRRAGASSGSAGPIQVHELVRDCCIVILDIWWTCGGYTLNRDGQPWTIEAAVVEYEGQHGAIKEPAVRAELAAIRVYVQIEWEIHL